MVRFLSLAVAASIAACACAGSVDDIANTLKKPLTSAGIQDDIGLPALKLHSKAFQDFADESGGTRMFGSKGYNASVDYVATLAELAGYEVTRQTFPHRPRGSVAGSPMQYSSNVIASSKAGDQNNVIFIGAHLDSVAAGPGINDNVSGAVALLELATQLAKYKLTNAVRFAWWTAEESGLVGSRYYVKNLSEAERKKIALYINLDMIASPNHIYSVLDGDGSAGINPGPTPPGSGAIEKVFTDYFASKKLQTVPKKFNGRSDYGSFVADGVGIPSGGLFTGAEGIKTEEQAALFGGKAGAAYDPNYHAKGDTYDNLNFEPFLVNAKATAHAVATFIESTKLVDAEKAAGRTKRQVVPAPNDNFPVQGEHSCSEHSA